MTESFRMPVARPAVCARCGLPHLPGELFLVAGDRAYPTCETRRLAAPPRWVSVVGWCALAAWFAVGAYLLAFR